MMIVWRLLCRGYGREVDVVGVAVLVMEMIEWWVAAAGGRKLAGVDVVFDGAFGGVGDEEVFVGGGLEEEALVEFMVELFEEDEDGKKNEKDGLFNLEANDQSGKA
ncbi:hypothetical protein Tco_0512312 [Tanacetum coccineum]